MLRRLTIFTVLLAAAGTTGIGLSTPAYAVDHVICVGTPPVGVSCDQTFTFLKDAVDASNVNGLPDTIRVAPGTYTDGPYTLNGISHHVTLQGSGQGSTVIELPSSVTQQDYLTGINATIQDLTVHMNQTDSTGDKGISTSNSTVLDGVTVAALNATNAMAIRMVSTTATAVTVQMPLDISSGDTGVLSDGASSITDSTITATDAFVHSGLVADTLSRVKISASEFGIYTDVGHVDVDDALIDLGTLSTGPIGLAAFNSNAGGDPMSITADHVTIVGSHTNGSIGAYAAATSPGVAQQSTIQLTNSIVRGPQTELSVQAGNDGTPGANSVATIITSYSDWSTQNVVSGPHGTATLTSGAGNLSVDPGFVDAAGGDYRLGATSPLIDKGAPGTSGPAADLSGGARILDGNGDGTAVRDMGAYEAPKKILVPATTAPNTTITAHPHKRTTKRRATFRFTATEAHVTFQCRLDTRAWRSCTSPRSYRVTRGWHVFKVRARDAAGNLDPTPARFRFHRV